LVKERRQSRLYIFILTLRLLSQHYNHSVYTIGRVGQKRVYTIYDVYGIFWQGNHQNYGFSQPKNYVVVLSHHLNFTPALPLSQVASARTSSNRRRALKQLSTD